MAVCIFAAVAVISVLVVSFALMAVIAVKNGVQKFLTSHPEFEAE